MVVSSNPPLTLAAPRFIAVFRIGRAFYERPLMGDLGLLSQACFKELKTTDGTISGFRALGVVMAPAKAVDIFTIYCLHALKAYRETIVSA
jgi:hypothetical protein